MANIRYPRGLTIMQGRNSRQFCNHTCSLLVPHMFVQPTMAIQGKQCTDTHSTEKNLLEDLEQIDPQG